MIEYIPVQDEDDIFNLFGNLDENKIYLEKKLDVLISLGDGYLIIKGTDENVIIAKNILKKLLELVKRNRYINKNDIDYLVRDSSRDLNNLIDLDDEIIVFNSVGRPIKPMTYGQYEYVKNIDKNPITFGIGPAGTGKTFLAVAKAVKALKERKTNRIILTRPAVEAGESLGFLPGDLQMKVDPYLRPLYDGIYELLGSDTFYKLLEKNTIEVAPLAYMRGRTLDNSYIILDEAQNTTIQQMKMFLTRIGVGSKAIITGDITQMDLSSNQHSGLIDVQNRLKDIEGIGFSYLSKEDVVRHSIVQKIIEAYEIND